jgi:tetratricopeptide (TPR) repeat protein
MIEPDQKNKTQTLLLEKTSVLGIFVRKMIFAFSRLQFDGLCRLWMELEQYKDVDRGSMRGSLSTTEADKYTSLLVQKLGTNWGLQHTRPDMDAMIASIKAANPTVSRAHVLSYLNCLIHRDFGGAVDSMHRYFDYSLQARVQEQQIAVLSIQGADQQSMPSFTSFLPYATLNLASVHLRFGHTAEALELIHETIRLVQERTDDVCLTLSLHQLQSMAASNGSSQLQFDLLKQCLTRSIELMLPITGSEVLLQLSDHYVNHTREQPTLQSATSGGAPLSAIQPAASFEHLQGAMRAALQGDADAVDKVVNGVLTQWAGLFDLLGQSDVSNLYTRAAASHDDLSAHIRLANQYASFGDFKLALRILIEADRKFNPHRNDGVGPRASIEWMATVRQILFDWSLYRCDFKAAELHALQLDALGGADAAGQQRHVEARMRLALISLQQEQYGEAHSIVESLLQAGEVGAAKGVHPLRPQFKALLLVTLAEILIVCFYLQRITFISANNFLLAGIRKRSGCDSAHPVVNVFVRSV